MSSNGGVGNSDDPTFDADGDWTQVAQRTYDRTRDGDLTTSIVYALAEAAGVEPRDLRSPPLYEVVDVPAIEETFFGPDVAENGRRSVGTTTFRYDQYLVKVRSDAWVQIYRMTDSDEATSG